MRLVALPVRVEHDDAAGPSSTQSRLYDDLGGLIKLDPLCALDHDDEPRDYSTFENHEVAAIQRDRLNTSWRMED